jgi:hypothetical protein
MYQEKYLQEISYLTPKSFTKNGALLGAGICRK